MYSTGVGSRVVGHDILWWQHCGCPRETAVFPWTKRAGSSRCTKAGDTYIIWGIITASAIHIILCMSLLLQSCSTDIISYRGSQLGQKLGKNITEMSLYQVCATMGERGALFKRCPHARGVFRNGGNAIQLLCAYFSQQCEDIL